MPGSPRAHTIESLLAEGFSRRTIRRYTNSGVLPHALGTGKSAHYTDHHIRILRAIKAARDENRRLADIAEAWQTDLPHLFERPAANAPQARRDG